MSSKKQELRAEILMIRAAMEPEAVVRASAAICRRVLDLPAFRQARCVLAYVDVRNEVRTEMLIRAALDEGKRVALPVVDRERRYLTAGLITAYPDDLRPGAYGIPEPRHYDVIPRQELDCILVPGVAYDECGYRLGFGGGYYDRLLPEVRPDAVRIGLGYDFQIRTTVYPETHDQAMDYVVTETRGLYFRGGILHAGGDGYGGD